MKREKLSGLAICIVLLVAIGCSGTTTNGTTAAENGKDATAPTKPTGLIATASNSSSISLNWNASTDAVGVTGYKIYKSGSQIATVANNAFNDSGLVPNTTYSYTVAAYDAAGNTSTQSSSASATTLAPGAADTTAPSAPSGLTATAYSTTQINLSWTAAIDDIGVAGYEVWQGATKIATVTTTAYSVTGLAAGTSYTFTVKAFDGASNVSSASSPATTSTLAAGGGTPPPSGSLRVRVVNSAQADVPNTIVVLGDVNGAMITSGTTNASGEVTFSSPPANATVSVASNCVYSGSTATNYYLSTTYDVNVPSMTAWVDDCNSSSSVLGTVTVNVTNSLGSVANNEVIIGNYEHGSGNIVTQQTYTVYQNELQTDGKLSIVVLGRNANYESIGYGMLLDQTFTNGMVVNIDVNQPMSYVQYSLANIPPSAKYLGAGVSLGRKGSWCSSYRNLTISSTLTSTTMNVPYVPGYGDTVQYYSSAELDKNNNGTQDAYLSLNYSTTATAPSNQNIDFSTALATPSSIVLSTSTGTATPTISWTGSDTNSTSVYGYADVNYVAGVNLMFDFTAAPTRTNLVIPQLPGSMSVYRPIAGIARITVENSKDSIFSGYNDMLTKADQYYSGTWPLPATRSYLSSEGNFSSTQVLAPKIMNKTRRR